VKKFVPAITVLFLCSLSFAETPAAAKVNPQQEAPAQDGHSHMLTPQQQELTADQQSKASALLQKVREATERFKDVAQAERALFPSVRLRERARRRRNGAPLLERGPAE